MKNNSFYVILILLTFSSFNIFGQASLTGTVREKGNNSKLEAVNVYIPVLQSGAVTNSSGEYKIENLPSGIFQVQISYVGYKSKVVQVNLKQGNNKLDVQLEPSNIEIGEVVVLGNSVNEIEKAPYKVENISVDKIRRDGFVTLQKSLSLLPGVSELSNGFSISKPVIRGLQGYRIAAIVNGLRFDNQEWQNEHGFGVGDLGIGSIKVIEGPAALLYGANTIGGAVNFVDPEFAPLGKTLGSADLEIFSNTLGANGRFGVKHSGEKISWQLYLGGESHADYLDGNENKIPNTRFAGISAKGIMKYDYDFGFSTLDYSFANNIYGVVEEADLNNPKDLAEDHFEREFEGPHHTIQYHIAALKNMFFSGDSRFKVNLGFQNNHRIEEEGNEVKNAANDNGELDLFLNTFSYDAEWIYPVFAGAELTIGTQGQIQSNENEGGRILVPNADMNEFSGFSYLKKCFEKLVLEGGVRYDINSIKTTEMGIKDSMGFMPALNLSYNNLNGALGGSFSPDDNWIFKLNFATGFRAPNLAELSSNGIHEGTTRYEIGNSKMESEKNYQVDLGVTFVTKNIKVSASAFNNVVQNFIYLSAANNFFKGNRIYQFIQNNSTIKGGELSLDLKPASWFDFNASFSTVIGKQNDGSYLPFMPADKIIAEVEFPLPHNSLFSDNAFNVRVRSYLEQNKVAYNEITTPAYSLLDAGLKSTVYFGKTQVNFALNATNILDKVYINHLSLLKPLGIYDMGRNISLTVNVPLEFN